jgi:hypothetical protein
MIKKLFACSIFLVLTLMIASCIVHRVDVVPVDVSAEAPIEISSPVKAHLFDGSTVVFPEGVNVYDGSVHGKGEMFNIALENNRFIDEIALDEVAAMESFQCIDSQRCRMGRTRGWRSTLAFRFVPDGLQRGLGGSAPRRGTLLL